MAAQNALQATTTYTAWEQVNKIVWKGLYLYHIMYKYHKNLMYMFFDYNQLGNKSLKQKFLPMESTTTTDGKTIEWYDYSMFDVEYKILAADTGNIWSKTWLVTALGVAFTTSWFALDDWILITKVNWTTIRKKITEVVPDTSIAWTWPETLAAWDKIIRLYYVQPDFTAITRGQSNYKYTTYKSYFQTFARTVTFNKTDLNKNYLIETDAKTYVAQIFGHNMNLLLQEFNKAIWMGRNWDTSSWAYEMLGIDTAIEQNITSGISTLVDFTWTADAKIKQFMDAIENASASWAVPSWEVLIVPCNRKFLSALWALKKDSIVYNEKIEAIDFRIFKFENMFGQVEFFHEPMLDILSQTSLAYILPRSLMGLRFRSNQNLSDEKGGMIAGKPEISVEKQITNIRDVATFDMSFEAGMILWGLSTAVYTKMKNL